MSMLSVVTLQDLTIAHVKLDFLEMAKVVLILMSASAVYTIVTIQLHVQTLLGPSVVRVTILILEMEKRAGIPWQNVKTTNL